MLRNPIVEQIRRGPGGGRIFPPNKPRDITTIEEDELARLRATAESMSGWHGSVARFLIGALPFTGLRPREIRLAKLDDVDLANGLWLVSSPKGEGRWAAPGFARIPPIAQQAVADFLAERAEYLAGEESEWLIPLRGLHDAKAQVPTITEASDHWLAALKDEVARRSVVKFRGWKTMRSTFCQNAIDAGASIEAVSKAMRHSSTMTTEGYYDRIRSSRSFAEIDKAFERPVKAK